ncbi:hypothetical protein [Bacillus weihaiensis]|uniref:hypothetical protein n=1 Tax=Bacillus weihaiensis TaxID=1547283 RepID=UPI002354F38B|nr:hypothetical protein [Bacillus weihaiensis]
MSRTRKDVSFSHNDPHEVALLNHALRQGVFSRYIKRLIDRDMQGVPVKRQSEPMSVNSQNIRSVI